MTRRLLFVLENYPPHIGGVEMVFKNLCEGLAAKGHKITVITRSLPNAAAEETVNGVRILRVASMNNRYLFTFLAVPKVWRYAKDADIIHTTTFNGAPPAWLGAKLRGKPVIITVHETWIGKWRKYTNFSAPKAWIHELLERSVFSLSYDQYVCVSQSTARQLGQALPGKKGRITTVYNGFDPSLWKKKHQTKDLRKQLGLEKKFVILGFGRPGTSKGFQYLFASFPKIKQQIPNAAMVLILSRDKQYAEEVDRMKAAAPADVHFVPSQPYKELPVFAQMADCIVVPSIVEGFGYAALEAASSGTPVVASDTTSIPEVIGGKYLLVPPRDPDAIASAVAQVKKGKYTHAPLKQFPWKRSVAEYEQLYRKLTKP